MKAGATSGKIGRPTPPPRWRPKMEDSGGRSWPTIAVATAAESRPRSRQGRSITTTAPDAGQDLMARDPTEQTPTGPRSPSQERTVQGWLKSRLKWS